MLAEASESDRPPREALISPVDKWALFSVSRARKRRSPQRSRALYPDFQLPPGLLEGRLCFRWYARILIWRRFYVGEPRVSLLGFQLSSAIRTVEQACEPVAPIAPRILLQPCLSLRLQIPRYRGVIRARQIPVRLTRLALQQTTETIPCLAEVGACPNDGDDKQIARRLVGDVRSLPGPTGSKRRTLAGPLPLHRNWTIQCRAPEGSTTR